MQWYSLNRISKSIKWSLTELLVENHVHPGATCARFYFIAQCQLKARWHVKICWMEMYMAMPMSNFDQMEACPWLFNILMHRSRHILFVRVNSKQKLPIGNIINHIEFNITLYIKILCSAPDAKQHETLTWVYLGITPKVKAICRRSVICNVLLWIATG